jgi:hypothetical protein
VGAQQNTLLVGLMLAQKLADLLLTEEPDCITQAGELLHALGEPWRPDFINANKLHNLRGKVLSLEGFILVHDKELCFFLIPLKYKKNVQATSAAFYYFINNSRNKYGNGKVGGPRTILSMLAHLNRVI